MSKSNRKGWHLTMCFPDDYNLGEIRFGFVIVDDKMCGKGTENGTEKGTKKIV